jgi:radical SAM superfamily enzyme YgiQ (UPF0313 family)
MRGGYERALANLKRHEIPLYATFILGYDEDDGDTLEQTLAFAARHRFYIVAFNHLTPFPGTPLYDRLQREGRLLHERWWLDPAYRYGMVPYTPRRMSAAAVQARCIEARQRFYSLSSILRRSGNFPIDRRSLFMWSHFFSINLLFRAEVMQRKDFPLGDESYDAPLVKAEPRAPMPEPQLAVSWG